MSDLRPAGYRPIETGTRGAPAWLLLLAGVLVVVSLSYLVLAATPGGGAVAQASPDASALPGGTDGGAAAPPVDEVAALQLIEDAGCQACHGPELEGQATFPSLLDVADGPVSDNLQDLAAEHPDDWAQLWIDGTGPEVEGIDRRGMPTFGEQLSPEQIQLIVDYLKSL